MATGPAPTPKHILQMRGSWRAKGRSGELQFPCERPSCPNWLSREAKAEWRRIVKELQAAGAIAKVDRTLLALYCDAVGEVEILTGRIAEREAAGADEKEIWHLRNARHKAADRVAKLAVQFGFSPAARCRIKSPEPAGEEKGELERFTRNRFESLPSLRVDTPTEAV